MTHGSKTCDVCKREILHVDHLVDAGTYGVITHRDCFEALTSRQVLRLLYLDDVRMGPAEAYDFERGFFPDGRAELAWAKKTEMPGARKSPV